MSASTSPTHKSNSSMTSSRISKNGKKPVINISQSFKYLASNGRLTKSDKVMKEISSMINCLETKTARKSRRKTCIFRISSLSCWICFILLCWSTRIGTSLVTLISPEALSATATRLTPVMFRCLITSNYLKKLSLSSHHLLWSKIGTLRRLRKGIIRISLNW